MRRRRIIGPSFPYLATPVVAVAAPAYQGPGDIVSGALYWFGTRAYSAAAANAQVNAVTVIDTTDGSGSGILKVKPDGSLDISSLNPAHTFTISQWWDQTGNGNHVLNSGGSAFSLTQGPNSKPALANTGSVALVSSGNGPGQVQPITVSTVINITSGNDAATGYVWTHFVSCGINFSTTDPGTTFVRAFNTPFVSLSKTTWHAIQYIFNSTNSDIHIDTTQNTVDAGTAGTDATTKISIQSTTSFGNPLFAAMVELGVWPVDFNAGATGHNSAAMNTNQHSYWGF